MELYEDAPFGVLAHTPDADPITYPYFLLTLAFNALVDSNRNASSKWACVLLMQKQYMLASYRRPFLLLNKYSKWDVLQLKAVQILIEAYCPLHSDASPV